MTVTGSLLLSPELGIYSNYGCYNKPKDISGRSCLHSFNIALSSHTSRQDAWSLHLLNSVHGPIKSLSSRSNVFQCQSFLTLSRGSEIPVLKSAVSVVTRSYNALQGSPTVVKLVPAVGIIAFAVWGLGPLMRLIRIIILHKSDSSWRQSSTHYVLTSYLQPMLLWTGATLICRALDKVILPTEVSQAVKQRLLSFVRSLSTVLAFAYCLSSLVQQTQKFFTETNQSSDARNMGFQFAGKAIYSAVWVAAVSLFMELLGFSTQKWMTAGGLGTVLLTLAGREIFTNFLSSIMIHTTRPFVLNEWIQTKIEGYEVSGTVEHVGWWSPTIIRGDDREAVHIPNHKFTVNVVRNLSQKTHWRIKTHLAISHLDVNKINNIVADMRKVLAKNPQVEQQKLHRRVFLDNVNPESQALLILVSCFVKTSHFEEYLCVKEAILQDLLRVISHHRARLATPMRTVQKMYSEPEMESVPFADTIFSGSRGVVNRSILLIEPSYKVNNGDDKTKPSAHSTATNEETDGKDEMASKSESKVEQKSESSNIGDASTKNPSLRSVSSVQNNSEKPEMNKQIGEEASERVLESKLDDNSSGGVSEKPSIASAASGTEKIENPLTASQARQEGKTRPALEDNIVLGVALEGSKRTLPIEEEMAPASRDTDSKELTVLRSGSGTTTAVKDNKDDQLST